MSEEYYVYHVTLGEEIVYVGKGKDYRYKHTTSGCSHNTNLNMLLARHTLLGEAKPVTKIVAYFENESRALEFEERQIKKYSPFCNSKLLPKREMKNTKKSYNKNNIILRDGFYHFNKRFGGEVMRCSLRTKDKAKALYMANLILLQIDKLYGGKLLPQKI